MDIDVQRWIRGFNIYTVQMDGYNYTDRYKRYINRYMYVYVDIHKCTDGQIDRL